jgi:hypothetical protein
MGKDDPDTGEPVMDQHMTTIEVDQETAGVLRTLKARAESLGVPLDVYLRALAEAETRAGEPPTEMTPSEKARQWREWVGRNAVRVNSFVDDSRESIYGEREDKQL